MPIGEQPPGNGVPTARAWARRPALLKAAVTSAMPPRYIARGTRPGCSTYRIRAPAMMNFRRSLEFRQAFVDQVEADVPLPVSLHAAAGSIDCGGGSPCQIDRLDGRLRPSVRRPLFAISSVAWR
jgi:hypothetical protein